MKTQLRFLSRNQFKIQEAKHILRSVDVDVIPIEHKIEELQTTDTKKLVRDKALKAFTHTGRPLFVEHTGLYLDHLNGFPGGLTQVFWDTLQADRFSELFGNSKVTAVTAKTVVAFIDGRQFHIFDGEITGNISPNPRGCRDFQWDCVFIPNGFTQTFAEMGDAKNNISMRRHALDRLAAFIKTQEASNAIITRCASE